MLTKSKPRTVKRTRLSSDYTNILQYCVLPLMMLMYMMAVFLYFKDMPELSTGKQVVVPVFLVMSFLALAFIFTLKDVFWDQYRRIWTYGFLGGFKTWDIDSLHIVIFPRISYGIGLQPVVLRSDSGKFIFFITRIKSPLKKEEHNIVFEFRKILEKNE